MVDNSHRRRIGGSSQTHLNRIGIGGRAGDLRKVFPGWKLLPPAAQVCRPGADIETDDWRLISAKFLKDPKNQAEYALKYSGPGNVFLSELCITNDGVVPIHDGTLRKMPPPFDKGYPEFEFKVLETTNWNGLVFPLRSMLHKYVPLPGATNRDDLFPSVTARLNLESFHAGFERPEVDLTRSKLIANDNRLPHLPQTASIRYIVMNDQWLPATNPALAQLAAAYNAAAKASPVRNDAGLTAQKRFIVLMVMLALTLGPVASFALIRNNRKNQQKNQQKKYYENINE